MKTVEIDLGDRSYQIRIGPGLMAESAEFLPWVRGKQAFILTNETVAPLYLDSLRHALAGKELVEMILPDGEETKSLDTAKTIFDGLLAAPCDRDVTVVALGGGVIGDMAGFAAACYQRGVPFIQVPTTLLSQVDSSVGGKTGVNHPRGKNMIGAFHQPARVIADTDSLASLSEREFSAGLAEVIKYGLINDVGFFEWLEGHCEDMLARDANVIEILVERSCRNKARIVELDERESGQRALLNLGHTFGHAIEAGLGYGTWLHGEAVATGMSMAAHMSRELGWLEDSDCQRVDRLLGAVGLPVGPFEGLAPGEMLNLMGRDKKVKDGAVRLVLMKGLGEAVLIDDYPQDVLERTLEAYAGRQAA